MCKCFERIKAVRSNLLKPGALFDSTTARASIASRRLRQAAAMNGLRVFSVRSIVLPSCVQTNRCVSTTGFFGVATCTYRRADQSYMCLVDQWLGTLWRSFSVRFASLKNVYCANFKTTWK